MATPNLSEGGQRLIIQGFYQLKGKMAPSEQQTADYFVNAFIMGDPILPEEWEKAQALFDKVAGGMR
jgi:hypothetical protein